MRHQHRRRQSLRVAEVGLELSNRHGYLFDAALCERVAGEALAALGSPSPARERLASASSHFEGIGAQPERERSQRALALLPR